MPAAPRTLPRAEKHPSSTSSPSSFNAPACTPHLCPNGSERGFWMDASSTDLAPTYAALILADDGVEITSEKILALTNAAKRVLSLLHILEPPRQWPRSVYVSRTRPWKLPTMLILREAKLLLAIRIEKTGPSASETYPTIHFFPSQANSKFTPILTV
ncbi:hypothetical protein NMY22_g7711 [Coprinellus aureogranulatus]|nr:hypothetical protein NMY22_g7711 [Coprinellus aureogranulatus]